MILRYVFAFALAAAAFAGDTAKEAQKEVKPTLYQRLGGMPAVDAVMDAFGARLAADTRVSQWFGFASTQPERFAAYKKHVGQLVCMATGGPCKYEGRDMASVHKGQAITNEAFDAVVEDMVGALDQLKVPTPEKNELLAILASVKPIVVQK